MCNNINLLFICLIFLIVYDLSLCFKSTGNKRRLRSVSNETSILDTGIGSIGLFLGNSIKHLPVPRKHYHFRIHHHYHNRDKVLKDIEVLPRDITICEGNPGSFCPNGTMALCTKNGAIRCIVSLWETELCDDSIFKHCAKISLPCAFYTPECRLPNVFGKQNGTFNVDLPCISILRMYSNLIYVNRTVIAQDLRKIYPPDMFCVTILALQAKLTKGEEFFDRSSKMFGHFAVKAFGVGRR